MENFKYFILGLLLGYLTIIALCAPISIVASQLSLDGFDKVIFWAFLMGPVFGVAYTSSKGYFGRLALITFVFCISLGLLMSIIFASALNGSEVGYNFVSIFANASIAITGVLFVYWYICIGMGECSFLQIYLIPLGIILLGLGVFALICLIGMSVAFAISILVAIGCVIAVIVLRKINGSALD